MVYFWLCRIQDRTSFGGGDSLSSGAKTATPKQVYGHFRGVACSRDRSQEPGAMTCTKLPTLPAMIDTDLRESFGTGDGDREFVPRPCNKRGPCLRVKPRKNQWVHDLPPRQCEQGQWFGHADLVKDRTTSGRYPILYWYHPISD